MNIESSIYFTYTNDNNAIAGETLVYMRALAPAEMASVESFLTAKYKL
jgi:hypothetical protein